MCAGIASMRHRSLQNVLAVALLAAVSQSGSPSASAGCGSLTEIPNFKETIDFSKLPDLPDECSRKSIEQYRSRVEIFRINIVEGFNDKLIDFANRLKHADRKIRRRYFKKKLCNSDEYEELDIEIRFRFDRIRDQHTTLYNRGIEAYSTMIGIHREAVQKMRLRIKLTGKADCK